MGAAGDGGGWERAGERVGGQVGLELCRGCHALLVLVGCTLALPWWRRAGTSPHV